MSYRPLASALVIVVVGLSAACSGAGSTGTTESPAGSAAPSTNTIATTSPDGTATPGAPVSCAEPPPSELVLVSPVRLTVEPNPVAAGTEAVLSVAAEGLAPDAIVGVGATWRCWDGGRWVTTHQIVRGYFDGRPSTLEVELGATTTIVALDLGVPDTSNLLIPDVDPGTYRIEDRVIGTGGEVVVGFVLVEVG